MIDEKSKAQNKYDSTILSLSISPEHQSTRLAQLNRKPQNTDNTLTISATVTSNLTNLNNTALDSNASSTSITMLTVILTITICIIIFWQFRIRQKTQPKKGLSNSGAKGAEAPKAKPQALADTHDTLQLLPDSLQQITLFQQLISPLNLELIQIDNWFPQHHFNHFELTRDCPSALTPFHCAAPANRDFILIFGQHLCETPSNKPTPTRKINEAKTKTLNFVMILRSYRLSIAPDPVNIYSHALETTAEGFHDTLILYKLAQPSPVSNYQQFISDGLAIFESLANPPDPADRSEWLNA
jgi:hypothetical protein